MSHSHRSRRTVLKALATGVAGGIATGSASAQTAFEDELATVEAATERYRDVRAALEDGFQPGGPYVPRMGWHWLHPERVRAAAENGPSLEEPQVLVYADTDPGSPDGHLVLAAAEWGVPAGAQGYTEENPPDLFSDDGADAEEHWHVHPSASHLFASGDGQVTDPQSLSVAQLIQRGQWTEVPPDRDVQPGDEVTADWGLTGTTETRTVDMVPEPHPDLLTLHAWVHLPNREHPLAETNPNLAYVRMLPSGTMSDHTAKSGPG
jgi:hypothetical protein